jgi:hypothetical protein
MILCKDCKHAVMYAMTYPTCAHPQARRDPVYGRPVDTCYSERDAANGRCGPKAIYFEEKSVEPPRPDAGSIVFIEDEPATKHGIWETIRKILGW